MNLVSGFQVIEPWQSPTRNARPSVSPIGPLEVGGLQLASNLLLAPMSGVTDCAFRSLVRSCSGQALGLVVSEFVAAEGLTRGNLKTLAMLRYQESERPVSIQIFGSEPARMAQAARLVEDSGADIVDINCGCPAPKVVRRGGGAELMRQGRRLREILRAVQREVSIPVTVKIRAGWDDGERNALAVARLVEEEGAAMLALHGRTRTQMYRGQADWDLVAAVHDALSIPVVGSGDLRTPREVLARLSVGCCDGVMVGRGALNNPWIFAQTLALAEGQAVVEAGSQERLRALREFRRLLGETLHERAMLGRLRGMACRLIKGMPGSAATRDAVGRAPSADEIERIVRRFLGARNPS